MVEPAGLPIELRERSGGGVETLRAKPVSRDFVYEGGSDADPRIWGRLLPMDIVKWPGIDLADRCEDFPGSKPQGYIVGQHSECDLVIDHPHVSDRQCLIYRVVHNTKVCVFLRDLSSNGTFVNQTLVGCNQVVELKDGDEVAVGQPRPPGQPGLWNSPPTMELRQQQQKKQQFPIMQYGSVVYDQGRGRSLLELAQHPSQQRNLSFRGHDGRRQDDRYNTLHPKTSNNDSNEKFEGLQRTSGVKHEAASPEEAIKSLRFVFRQVGPIHRIFAQQYTVLDFIGKGHFGKVFSCKENSTGELFAMKRHEFSAAPEDRLTKRIVAAELNLMGLCHKNIVFTKEAFSDENSSSQVTQLAEGGELFDLIVRKSKLSEGETRHIFQQVFAAVKYLHDRNVVHRDLKPESILLLDKDYNTVLSSFGLSIIIATESIDPTLLGALAYVAPELLGGRQHKYGKGVDIWSLGVVLYICLCGFPPFSDELYCDKFPYTMSQQIRAGRFDYPSPYWDSVSDTALDLIDSMLVIDPMRRFTIDQCLAHPWLTQLSPGQEFHTEPGAFQHCGPTRSASAKKEPVGLAQYKTKEELPRTGPSPRDTMVTPLPEARGKGRPSNPGTKSTQNIGSASKTLTLNEEFSEHDIPRATLPDQTDAMISLGYDSFAGLVNDAINTHTTPETPFTELPEDLQIDMEFNLKGQDMSTWTCTPSADVPSEEIPLRVDGHPVVLPVEYKYPLTGIFSPPPDPHHRFISPSATLSDEDIHHVFSTFPACIGFYLMINRFLQIIMPEGFDYEEGVPSLPSEFGGLKVSLIPEAVFPTAGEASTSSPSATTTSTRTALERIFGQSSSQSTAAGPARATGSASNQPINAVGVSVGCAIRAIVPGSKSKQRFEGKTGVAISPRDDVSKKYITIPTHLLTDSVIASKTTSLESDTWRDDVKVCVASNLVELGKVTAMFDEEPKSFPVGFSHDVSLVDISGVPDVPRTIPYATDLTWLSQQEWMDIKYNSSNLVLLDDRSREAKSIGIVDSRCQMVGQGIFRIQQESRKRPSFLGSLSSGSSSSRAQDPRDEPSTWTSLVARSILYRVNPDYPVRGGQSGVPVCVVGEHTGGTASRSTKVVGFASFVQMVSGVQKYDLDGDRLYKRLQEGRVAFYGAFQVPQELREGYQIL